MLAPRPYSCAFAASIASSIVRTRMTGIVGPNVSVATIRISGRTSTRIVGS